MIATIRQVLYLLDRRTRRRWWLLMAMALGTSVLEVVAAALIYMLLSLVADPGSEMQLPLLGDLRALAGDMSQNALLLRLIGVMIAFFVIRAAVLITSEYLISRVIQSASASLSSRLVKGYLALPFSFHLQRNSAELIRNSQQVPLTLATLAFSPLFRVGAEAILVMGILVLLLLVSPLGTGLAVVFVGGTSAILLFTIQPRLRRIGAESHAMNKETLQAQQHCFNGVREIKILGRERFFAAVYQRNRKRLARMEYLRTTLANIPPVIMDACLIGFILIFFAIAIAKGAGGQAALATLGLFGYAGLRLQPSLKIITHGLNSLKFTAAPIADLYADLRLIEALGKEEPERDLLAFEQELRFAGVDFRYEGSDRDSLKDIGLVIHRGEQIGICGPTGGGKSTLIDIMTGLLEPTRGHVFVDGQDIHTNLHGWQRNLGLVPQTVFMIDDSLARNIALGVDEDQIDIEAVQAAVHLAQLDGFVASLPLGLDTVIGERGARVSGGERQRIAIARALYNRPKVLILDEGTSALDNMTEGELMTALGALREAHTIVLVAHRLSTVRNCDRVVLVEDGRIAAVGSYEELRESNESFRQMVTAGE